MVKVWPGAWAAGMWCVVLAWAGGARAQTTIYVASAAEGGSDANSGSAGSPLLTVQRAADMARAGDTVVVGPGAFAGFNIGRSGRAGIGGAITFRGTRGGDGSWRTVVNTAAARFNGTTHLSRINIDTASYIVIEDFEVVGTMDQRTSRAGVRAVTPPGIDHGFITVRGCHIHHNGKWGVFTGHMHDVTVEGCEIHSQSDEHGVYLSNSGDDHIVRGNVIWGNSSNGLHVNADASQGGDGIIANVRVEGNTFYSNGGGGSYIDGQGAARTSAGGGSAVNLDGVIDSLVVNNVMLDGRASGVSLYRIDGAIGSSNNVVANNTIVSAAGGRWCVNIQNGSTGNRVFNNILLSQHAFRGSVTVSADSLDGLASDYNIVMDRMDPGSGSPQPLAAWRTVTGQDAHSVGVSATQFGGLFRDFVAGDVRLAATSIARNAGSGGVGGMAAPMRDREGRARPQESAFDIGAYEFPAEVAGCRADFNGEEGVTLQDLFDYLAAFLQRDARADFNRNGLVSVQDLFDFLEAYFAGC